jgi:hypothetical protein
MKLRMYESLLRSRSPRMCPSTYPIGRNTKSSSHIGKKHDPRFKSIWLLLRSREQRLDTPFLCLLRSCFQRNHQRISLYPAECASTFQKQGLFEHRDSISAKTMFRLLLYFPQYHIRPPLSIPPRCRDPQDPSQHSQVAPFKVPP